MVPGKISISLFSLADKHFQGMVKKKKGCKTCGFVFCRCHGWEYKPKHCK